MPSPKNFAQGTIAWILALFSLACEAAKVELDPSNWGSPVGEQCISCHEKASAGLTAQWRQSAHAEAGVNCMDCHQADPDDIDAITHEGYVIATIVSPLDCGRCHTVEHEQQRGTVHAEAVALIEDRLPAFVENVAGPAVLDTGCAQCHGSRVRVLGDGTVDPGTWPNSGIGRINPDGSKGSCSSCHGRHRFSKAQAREPEACVRCHSGPDSPDKEVFEASKHGMSYVAHRAEMNTDSPQWVAGKDYTAAPTCVTCHMGAAGKLPSTHDVGMRNAWSLNSPVSERQYLIVFKDGDKRELPESEPAPRRGSEMEKLDGTTGTVKVVASPDRRREAMTLVCLECHGKGFATAFMSQFDDLVSLFNDKFAKPARAVMAELYEKKLLTPTPFDEPIEYTYWEMWHDEGARARHGAAMASPNHAWWEGMYVVGSKFYGKFLPEVREVAGSAGEEIVQRHIGALEQHAWLARPDQVSPILGLPTTAPESEQP